MRRESRDQFITVVIVTIAIIWRPLGRQFPQIVVHTFGDTLKRSLGFLIAHRFDV